MTARVLSPDRSAVATPERSRRPIDPTGERRGKAWLVVALLALVGVLFLAGFPARDYVAQRRERREVAARIRSLAEENRALTDRQARLQTDGEIERLARQHYNLVRPGEEVFAIIPGDPPAPAPSPAPGPRSPGWWDRALGGLTGLG